MFLVDNNNFPAWLQDQIDKRNWSQSDLARFAGLNRAVINKALNSQSKPAVETLESIARGLKLSPEVVFRAAGLLPPQTDEDPWVEEMSHNLGKLTGARRAIAESLVRSLIEQEEKEAQPAAAHKATQPR